jgi:hypothetical protein
MAPKRKQEEGETVPASAPVPYTTVPIDFSAHPSTQFQFQIVKDSKGSDTVILKRVAGDIVIVAQTPQFSIHFANNLISSPFKAAKGKAAQENASHVVTCNLSTSFYKKDPGDVFITWCNNLDDMLVETYYKAQRLLGKASATKEIIAGSNDRIFSSTVNKDTGIEYPACAKLKRTHKTDASVPIYNLYGDEISPTHVQNYDVVSATFMLDQPVLTKEKRFRNALVLLSVTQLGSPGLTPDPTIWKGYEGSFGSHDQERENKITEELAKFKPQKIEI